MNKLIVGLAVAGSSLISAVALARPTPPTIVLVHGAFADGSSWDGVIRILERDGYHVIAAAIPLRSLKGDADYIGTVVASAKGPVVLVGHSYAGSVISEAADTHPEVGALVYVSAFAPEAGETAAGLTDKLPGSRLSSALASPVPLPDGGSDLYVQQGKFRAAFAADVGEAKAELMAATQRPVTAAALSEASSEPGWKNRPVWFIYGDRDEAIPPQVHAFMAARAHAIKTVVLHGASHVTLVSHPGAVAALIEDAAEGVAAQRSQ